MELGELEKPTKMPLNKIPAKTKTKPQKPVKQQQGVFLSFFQNLLPFISLKYFWTGFRQPTSLKYVSGANKKSSKTSYFWSANKRARLPRRAGIPFSILSCLSPPMETSSSCAGQVPIAIKQRALFRF